MTRKYKVERTHFIGCQNISYMDVSDAKPCPFCGGVEVTITPIIAAFLLTRKMFEPFTTRMRRADA